MVERQEPVAVITGAGRGIGRATALELADRGYHLALAARSADQLEESGRLVQARRPATRIWRCPMDVSNPRDCQRLIDGAGESLGRVDALVHCAGLAPAVALKQMTIEQWREVIDTNLSSAFYLARAVWPVFARQQSGVIVNISSMASRDPLPGFGAYGAAKSALNTLSLMLSREGAAVGMRVHTIAPGAVETAMFRALLSEEQYPRDRTLDPAEVARVIAGCVCGDLRHTSGEVIFLSRSV